MRRVNSISISGVRVSHQEMRVIVKNEPIDRILDRGNLFFTKNHLYIIVFIVALLTSILISHPQFLINDEWITANQLAQLDQGHQFAISEGKYGAYPNGTPYHYFQSKNNALGYPIFLPIISLPALIIIKILGDNFDYWLMTIWSLLLIFLGLMIQKFYPMMRIFLRIPLSSILIILAFFIFILNIILYLPFTISPNDAPSEAAAIILTNNLLFAGLVVTIFGIISTIFKDRWYSYFGTLVCVTSSSYLIWTSSAKDHMLELFLFGLIVFGVVNFFYSGKIRYCFFSFFILGLLAWDRPELGIVLFALLFLSLIPYIVRQWKITKRKLIIGYLLISPLFTAIGAIPLLVNNYIVTKNPFLSTYSVWGIGSQSLSLGNTSTIQGAPYNAAGILTNVFQLASSQFNPHFDTLIHDLLGILFLPEIGTIGVLLLVPIFLIGVLSIPMLIKYESGRFSSNELYLIIPLVLMTLAIFIAYISIFPILNNDPGVAPDVRYLSLVYLPLNLIGLIILSKFPDIIAGIKEILRYFMVFSIGLIPIFMIIISINNDPNAPINKIADYTIIGNVGDILPKMIKYYKENSK